MSDDWRRDRDEYIAGRLDDEIDREEYERQRDIDLDLDDGCYPSFDEMIRHFADERIRMENERAELEDIAERAVIEQWRRDRREARGE